MATKEKPKKGGGATMHVYKMDTGYAMAPPTPMVTKKMVSSSRSWGLLKRSKTYKDNNVDQLKAGEKEINVVVERGRKSVSNIVEARKSVSNMVEARKSSVSIVEGRKSVASKVEAINVEAMAGFLKAKVLVTDMPGFMQVHALRCARQTYDCLDNFTPKTLAHNMKKPLDYNRLQLIQLQIECPDALIQSNLIS
uniref:Uncharacterized protein n=1 Tax=Daucus carota subsp. sativus TaxID=79200 RepID=A0A164YIY4_DAUCS